MGKLVLEGIEGTLKDKKFFILLGESVIMGRSRSCDIPLNSGVTELLIDEPQDKAKFRTVSRRHLCIRYYQPDEVELEDLSSNGSFLNGKIFNKRTITDIQDQEYTVLLGSNEKFTIRWEEEE